MTKKTYNVYISSADRISGTHNNAVYDINWESFMPHNPHIANGDQIYEVSFAFVTSEGDIMKPMRSFQRPVMLHE
jgi:hypothetical protein